MDDLLRQIQRLQVRELEINQTLAKQERLNHGRVAELERDLTFFRKRCGELEEKFRMVQMRESESQDIRNQLEVRVTEEVDRLQQETERLRKLLSLASDDFARLKTHNEGLETKYKTATSQLELLARTVQQKEGELRATTQNVEEQRERWLEEERAKGWEQLRTVNSLKAQEIKSLHEKKELEVVRITETKNQELMELAHSQNTEKAKLNDELRRTRDHAEHLKSALEHAKVTGERELQQFRRQLESKQWELEKQQGDMKDILQRIETLELDHQDLLRSNTELKDRHSQLSTKHAATEHQLTDAKKWGEYLNSQISEFESSQDENAILRKELTSLTAKHQRLLEDKDDAERKVKLLEQEILDINNKARLISDNFRSINDRALPVRPSVADFDSSAHQSPQGYQLPAFGAFADEFTGKKFRAPTNF